jgi:hypothetical protein
MYVYGVLGCTLAFALYYSTTPYLCTLLTPILSGADLAQSQYFTWVLFTAEQQNMSEP